MQLQDGLDGARWRDVDHFHLTLAFLGDVDRHSMEDAISALDLIKGDGFDLTLKGCGFFGDRKPRAVWSGVEHNPALEHIHRKINTALRRNGIDLERRKFTPHVTLAYLKNVPRSDAAAWCSMHGLYKAGPFPINEFHLIESHLGRKTSHYEIIETYSLSSAR